MSFGKKEAGELEKAPLGVSSKTSGLSGGTTMEAFLGSGTRVIGTLHFSGPVQLDGEIEGEISCKDKLNIGQTANIKAKIAAVDVIVQGSITGDISASKSISLKKPAKVIGNISCESLSIEEGVVFEGNCSMKPGGSQGNGLK